VVLATSFEQAACIGGIGGIGGIGAATSAGPTTAAAAEVTARSTAITPQHTPLLLMFRVKNEYVIRFLSFFLISLISLRFFKVKLSQTTSDISATYMIPITLITNDINIQINNRLIF